MNGAERRKEVGEKVLGGPFVQKKTFFFWNFLGRWNGLKRGTSLVFPYIGI